MAHAYTPGLKVSGGMALRKIRRLPLPGHILVDKGKWVDAETIVARTELPGQVQSANVAGILGIQPEEIDQYMLKQVGQPVKKDEVIASTNMAKAATKLATAPGALHLRTLQSINDLSSDQSNTVIFAVPLEILRAFEGYKKK